MNCNNCPYNQNGRHADIIRHTQGNILILTIPIKFIWASVIGGEVEKNEQGEIAHYMDLTVEFRRGNKVYPVDASVFDGQISVTVPATLPIGTYSIEIRIDDGGNKLRYKKKTLLRIVDTTAEGGEYANDEMELVAVYPVVEGEISAITVGDGDVTISEHGKFQGDDTPNDEYADISAAYGDSTMEVGEDDVTITI